jgi:ATP adenylyltransferase
MNLKNDTYNSLVDFTRNKMRMSHIYQPMMIMTLLRSGGICRDEDIAKAILEHDQSQIEYYTHITNNMVGRVLRRHSLVEKRKKEYSLVGFENLTPAQTETIIEICKQKLDEYMARRGSKIWSHRKLSAGYISGTVKYEVLKRAKFHCELCGISADQRALEVDHIIPRNLGGSDDTSNLQALCYSCNSMKRDRDTEDFTKTRESFRYREKDCLFCNISEERIILNNELAYAIQDAYPVTPLHSLIVPKRHAKTYFELGRSEINACNELLNKIKNEIQTRDTEVNGFNIGVNNGESAGQTISHCHIHLIPRRTNDVDDPRGGVRHTIPYKGYY